MHTQWAAARCVRVFAAVLAALSLPAQAADPTPYVGRRLLEFEYRGQLAMQMPTAVAVAAGGAVFVADGVNDRVLEFDAQGRFIAEIHQVGQETLARPVSLKVDATGRLWIADTGHQRVLVRSADGALERMIELKQGSSAHLPDITDVVPRPDGASAWLVDNDNNRLVLADLSADTQTLIGEMGESLGQFHYPFMAALGREGDILVTDVINGRVQVLTGTGRPAGALGTYGAGLGQLYRPKGVACDVDGLVWVSDGTLGVVQVFTPTGTLSDVLRGEDGRPLKLASPLGLAFDQGGNLYVVELTANRVVKLGIEKNANAESASREAPPPGAGGTPARACTVCHIEWLPPFSEGRGTVLMDAPVADPEQPVVSRSTTCLSCHDTSVVDSRLRVWQQHGHGTGIKPPPGMVVPPQLPLVAGHVACRTCHSAHTTGPPSGDLKQAVFLRVQNTASELCISCHADKTRGPGFGTHPTGGMPWPVPNELVRAGARVGPNPRELTCQVCHTPHGAAHEHLLVMGTESNQLCLTCHGQMRPGMFREGAAEHPLSPKVNAEQLAAIHELGTKVGPDDRLICLSCHKLHHGKGERFMLADELRDGQMCLHCHADRKTLVGTSHDLRAKFPNERNRLGMTPASGGPCSSCHLFHRYARAPEVGTLDPGGGKCITCHQPGRVAEAKALGPVNHPQARCTECHNPHETRFANFLIAEPSDVCSKCHADHTGLTGGPHDATCLPQTWPPAAAATKDRCLACHRPHGTEDTGLFRLVSLDPGSPNAACLPCHGSAARDATGKSALVHPQTGAGLPLDAALPLGHTADGQAAIACFTCHDPHRTPGVTPRLLRSDSDSSGQQLCFNCHKDMAFISTIGHARDSLRAAGFAGNACQPCHDVHADPRSVEPKLLWPARLTGYATGDAAAPAANRYCLACHREGGPVSPPGIATHPQADMFNADPPDTPGYLPLFNEAGEVDPKGTIACRTCHLTHGRSTPAPLPPDVSGLGERELRARRWHLRSFSPTNVCSTCHGFDALRRFMYFHDATRRGGPIEAGGTGVAPARPTP